MEHSVQEVTFHHEPGGSEVVKKIIKTSTILIHGLNLKPELLFCAIKFFSILIQW